MVVDFWQVFCSLGLPSRSAMVNKPRNSMAAAGILPH